MNSRKDLAVLLKTQISLTQLRDDLHLFNYPDQSDSVGALRYIERSLNNLISQISETTHYTQALSSSQKEVTVEEEEDWEMSATVPFKPGEIDQICHILEAEV